MRARSFAKLLWVYLYAHEIAGLQTNKVKCLENGRFYRDPERPAHKMWTMDECSRYFLCLEGEVFDFRCSVDLLFDVDRQICDFKVNVDNCDITAETTFLKPMLDKAKCSDQYHLGCADGTCLPQEYFCDGSLDCPDGSDEGLCDLKHDPNGASPCDPRTCLLPSCYCSENGTQVPGNLPPSMIPQMVLLTFDDAVNDDNWDLYAKELFPNFRKNPNKCPVRATFFVSHQYNNYQCTQQLWNDGHEIAVHSITYWKIKISYPEVWELPLNPMEVKGYTCSMVDACPSNLSAIEVYEMLTHNFKRHYLSNRAPFGLHFHSSWFKNPEYLAAFQKFLTETLRHPDVWFVTNNQAIEWMKRPTSLNQLHTFEPWNCKKHFEKAEIACNSPNICQLHSRVFQQNRYLRTCSDCPQKYPWIRNEFGFD
nr:uncharacterized protein LOC111510434 [Leptinotarsa decemlineata]